MIRALCGRGGTIASVALAFALAGAVGVWLGWIGREDAGAAATATLVARLIDRLASVDLDVRHAAEQSLRELGPVAIASFETALLPDRDRRARLAAAEVLLGLLPAHSDAASVVIESLTTPGDDDVALEARAAVQRLAPLLRERVAALRDDPSPRVRRLAD